VLYDPRMPCRSPNSYPHKSTKYGKNINDHLRLITERTSCRRSSVIESLVTLTTKHLHSNGSFSDPTVTKRRVRKLSVDLEARAKALPVGQLEELDEALLDFSSDE
jgi:Domain of unknown function (DUF4351)